MKVVNSRIVEINTQILFLTNTSTEDGPALICIPDITGFTRFMAETNMEYSKKIIPSLLRDSANSNMLDLKVEEVEGDAILFYRYGALPLLKDLMEQCKNFYVNLRILFKTIQ